LVGFFSAISSGVQASLLLACLAKKLPSTANRLAKKKDVKKKQKKSYVPLLKSHVQTYSKQNVTYFQQHH